MNRKRIALFFVLILLITYSAFSKDLAASQISGKSLRELLSQEYYKDSSIDEDGDLLIKTGGVNLYLRIDAERFLLKFTTSWEKNDSISDAGLNKILCNWNTEKIFANAYSYNKSIRLQYYMCFDGGVNSENLNSTLEWLFSLADSFWDFLEEEDAI